MNGPAGASHARLAWTRTAAPSRSETEPMTTGADIEAGDPDLLRRYAHGDQGAARVLTARHAPRVFALARRLLNDPGEAEDVTQEAMLRLWRVAPDWEEGRGALSTWLYRVTSNLCFDRLRRRREMPAADLLPELPDPAGNSSGRGGAHGTLIAADRTSALSAALARLPERQRLAVVLRHLKELGNPEVAAVLGTSVEAVESLLARARRTLAADLAGRRDELGYTDD